MAHPVLKSSSLPIPLPSAGDSWMTAFSGGTREVYRRHLAELERRHRAGASGTETASAVSTSVETVVRHLHETLREWMAGRLRREPAVIALGGLGRRELSPRSDVDLLFLWDKKPGSAGTAFAGYLVRMLWDAGLELAHTSRTLAELRGALAREGELKTAMLDARWLAGEEKLKDAIPALKTEIRERESGVLLEAKLEETRGRWRKSGWTYHLVEPNVRESPGGLLDYQAIRWVGMVLPWNGALEGLHRLAVIDRSEIRGVRRAFDFLLRVRNELHFLKQTNWNVLTLDMQRQASRGLGYVDAGGLLAVERFMSDYYSKTGAIYALLERLLEETRGRGNLRIIDGALYRRVGTKGLGRLDLRLSRARMREDPLFMFKEAMATGKGFSPRLERRIRTAFAPRRLPAETLRRMRASFVEILETPGPKAPVLRGMHELGCLRHLFPPFERLTCLKKYDLYHQFTADEHSLQAIANIDELAEQGGGLLARIHDEVSEKTELVLAALLHDIGRPSVRAHARSGARMADELLRSFPIPARSRALVRFVVREHLLLAHFSQRRDMEDRDTVLQFVKMVRSHRNLKLLYLLTYADLKATGPSVWTGWKENLLEDLYFKASRMLAERPETAASDRAVLERRREKILEVFETDAERSAAEAHLANLPERYAMVVPPARVKAHVEMAERLRGRPCIVETRRLQHSIELTVCMRDRPYRLSRLCGVITINGLNILGAYAFTRKDGIVIDIFHCVGLGGAPALSDEASGKLERDFAAALGGEMDLEKAFEERVSSGPEGPAPAPLPTTVEFENDLSRESTIIDVTARDRPGLLYLVTRALSEEGLDIQSAQIATRGDVAADSFYARTSDGRKIGDPAAMRRVRQRIRAALDAPRRPS